MSASAPLLLDMTLKALLLCVAGSALAGLARRRSAALRHDIWMAVIACCTLVPVLTAILRIVDPVLPIAPVHSAVMAIVPSLPPSVPTGAIEVVDRIWSGDGGAVHLGWMGAAIVVLWLTGFALTGLRTLSRYRAAAAIVRRAMPYVGAASPPGVRLRITSELPAPAVFGQTAPAILLPAEAVDWPGERLRAVVAHEMAHVERRDCALELLVQLACMFHWFNPLVWKAARALRLERELACDDRVVAAGLDARTYAAALVHVARTALGPSPGPLLAMARQPELERRIELLLAPSRPPGGAGRVRAAAAWLAVALFLPAAVLTAPASGLLASGSVQPGDGPVSGLDDPMSELVPLAYDELAARAAAVPAAGAESDAIAALRVHLDRVSHGYGDLVRERAIWTLTRVRDGRLFESVAEHVADRDWRVRAYAAWGLAAAGDRRATPLLVSMLDDPVWRVRAMAAAALAEIADPSAADAVAETVGDPAWQVRISALEYAERAASPELARRLRPLLTDPHPATRLKAERVLTHF